ncbi:MAG: DEAD/DEAH box helicase [Deltaproteobacteria bacterium]|nr:DEAD/DEAH box helicase [Deltaproteobacteria bacterium]
MTLLLPSSTDPFHQSWADFVCQAPESPPRFRGLPGSGPPPTPRLAVLDVRESMAFEMLLGLAGRRMAPVPPEVLVTHVLTIHAQDGWVVQRAAFEALLERVKLARAAGLLVRARPRSRRPYGVYRISGPEAGSAPLRETWLMSMAPLRASCDCRDFLRSSLGVCAHVFAVLADVVKGPEAEVRARRARALTPAIDWDPVRPLHGDEDPFGRIRAAGLTGTVAEGGPNPEESSLPASLAMNSERSDRIRAMARWSRLHPDEVTPAARAVLEDLEGEVDGATRRALHNERAMQSLDALHRPPYAYQREGVARILSAGRLLLGDDMGLGKTAQAIGACHALHHVGEAQRGLLIVPAPLKRQWAREWRAFTDLPVRVVEGDPAARRKIYGEASAGGFLIMNYELLRRDVALMALWAPDVVVIDEAQRIKNPETKTAQAVKALASPYRIALTGTPLENRFDELASIMEWVDDRALAPLWRLRPVHGGLREGGVMALGTLRARLEGRLLRRRRREILTELPPRTDTVVSVERTDAQWGPHKSIGRSIARLVKDSRRRPLTPGERVMLMSLLTKQRIVANGRAQADFEAIWPMIEGAVPSEEVLTRLSTPKLREMRRLLRSLVVDQERTVVVFSQWRRMLRLVEWATRDVLRSAGLQSVFFTGKESVRARDRSIVELHDDPLTRVLFATDCAGVGLNLQCAATVCINVELPWNPAILEQRVARLHRLGQRAPIDVVNLVTEESIEARIASVIQDKRAIFEGLFDSDLDAIAFEPQETWWEVVAREDQRAA